MIRGIHHFAMHTPNFDAMAKFYREGFGFEPAIGDFRWGNNPTLDARLGMDGSAARTVMLKAGNCYLELFEYSSPPPRDAGAARPHDHGYTHFCVDVKDIAAESERLAALGMTFPLPLPIDFTTHKFIYGKDPDGNVIELQELTTDNDCALERLECVAMAPSS